METHPTVQGAVVHNYSYIKFPTSKKEFTFQKPKTKKTMGHNLPVLAIAALIPLIVGSAWYSPLLFSKAWMEATGITPEKAKNSNMVVSMALLYVCSFFIAFTLMFIVIHQFGFQSMLQDHPGKAAIADPTTDMGKAIATVWQGWGHSFRTYKHGALHGALTAVFFALPFISSMAVFEQRGWKYILITWGFWFINLTLMGAVICHWISFDALQAV
jgi:hypothetical protein